MTRAILPRTFWRFLMVGMSNTLAGLACIFGARAAGMGEVAANATGYTLGLILSFSLNRRWTFGHDGPLLPGVLKFLTIVMTAWLANLAVLLTLIRWGVAPAMAQVGAVLPYTLISYLGCRWWVFADRE